MAATPAPPPRPALLPLPPAWARRVLLGATLVCAICGFAYELVLVALGTVLFGSSTAQTAMVLGTFVAAMGVGSWAATKLPSDRPIEAFVVVEGAVALLGGLSAIALYSAYAWLDLYGPAVRALSVTLGVLVGAELPLLTAILQRIREQRADQAVGTLLAADYVGAFAVGLAFPLYVLPTLGKIDAALAFGALNVAGGATVLWLMRHELHRRAARVLGAGLLAVLALLGVAALQASAFQETALQALYDDPIVHTEQTPYQEITVTRSRDGRDLRLFLNGDLQFSSVDEYRYHEALVHPALDGGPHARVLVLGGGDGLAVREVLRHRDVRQVVEVELDPRMIELARTLPALRALNRGALDDPRVRVVTADAFSWLREGSDRFDVVIADFPDPDSEDLAKLYSVEVYGMLARRHLTPGGRVVVQAGSPFFAPEAFWGIDASLRAAGLRTRPYHVDVPSFGDWGFLLAAPGRPPALRTAPAAGRRFLTPAVLQGAAAFPADRARSRYAVAPTTIDRPAIVEYERRGWQDE